jgi:aminoglycoside phosphotransferase (APT) family kinase protein
MFDEFSARVRDLRDRLLAFMDEHIYPNERTVAEQLREGGRAVPDVLFYYCFGLFKIAVIVQQIYARYAREYTKDPRFARLNDLVAVLSQQADRTLEAGRL